MNSQRAKRLLTLIALLVYFSLSQTLAQQNTDPRVFHISVVDEEGKPQAGLKAEDFQAWVDKAPRKVVSLTNDNAPISMGILLDLSGSFGPPDKKAAKEFRRKLSDAITHFLKVSSSDNDYFVGTFNTRVAFSETWTGPGPEQSIFEKLAAPEQYGTTAMYDALYHGIQDVMKGRHSRHVILIISDGLDNESKRSYKEVAALVKKSNVAVYAIAVYDGLENSLAREGLEVLDDLTKLSGGRTAFLKPNADAEMVKNAFQIVADNLQSQYRLSLENETVTGPEKWRKLKLKLNLPDEKGHPKLFIWSRPGYYQ